MEQKSHYDIQSPSRLLGLLGGDFAAAAISATFVAPMVTIIDRAIVEKASSNQPLLRSLGLYTLTLLKKPSHFFFSRPFGIVWSLYAGTYTVANGAETLCESVSTPHVGGIVFASTFLVNVPLGVWKDIRFSQIFSNASVPANVAKSAAAAATAAVPMPKRVNTSRAATTIFLARDALTIFGSFTLAPRLAAAIPDGLAWTPQTQAVISQLTVPALTQIPATPLHILGLDLCNRPYNLPWSNRVALARNSLMSTTAVRCFRILPAFGFGCLANAEMRETFHKKCCTGRGVKAQQL